MFTSEEPTRFALGCTGRSPPPAGASVGLVLGTVCWVLVILPLKLTLRFGMVCKASCTVMVGTVSQC